MNADFHVGDTRLITERLILRAFGKGDLSDFNKYASVPGVGEAAGWKHHGSIAESRRVLSEFIREDRVFALELRETGTVIGSIGVERYGMEEKLSEFSSLYGCETGFVLSREYWGRGLMTEAVMKVIGHLFNERNLDFILSGHYIANERSRRVQEKCGFRPYRKLMTETFRGTREEMCLNLLLNPEKDMKLSFSHPETLVWKD